MAEEKRDLKVNHTRVKEGDFVRNLWVATVEQGTKREDLLNPTFWSHVAVQFRPYDRIEVRPDDGTYFAEFLVLSCERTYAKLKELSWHSLTTQDIAMTEDEVDYEHKFRGPRKHSVIRKSDGAVMIEDLATQEEALNWMNNHMKAIER